MNNIDLIYLFSQFRPSSTILSIKHYKNNYDEISNFSIAFHINYLNALKSSKTIVENYKPRTKILKEAKILLLNSYANRIENFSEDNDPTYNYFYDAEGKIIKGLKQHNLTGELYLFGTLMSKKIIETGRPRKEVKSSDITLAKREIESLTTLSRFRQFILSSERYESIKIEGMIIE